MLFLAALLASAFFPLGGRAAEPLPRHLFLDPALVAQSDGVRLVVNPAQRREVVIRPDRPWENLMISFYLTVREEEGKLRMWYLARDKKGAGGVGYAESTDGVNWTKPELGLVDYEGSRANNLTNLPSGDGTPFLDPHAPPGSRYTSIGNFDFPGSVGRYTSADGLDWKRDATSLLPFPSDTQNVSFWDPNLNQYVLYLRGWTAEWYRNVKRVALPTLDRPSGIAATGRGRPAGAKDKAHYLLDELPTVLACDSQDPARSDIYTMAAQPYPLDPSWYVAFPAFLRRSADSSAPQAKGPNRGPVETQFTGSRDGITWHRYNRAAYASPSQAAPDKHNMVFMGTGVIVRGNELWQYATEFESEHGDSAARQRKKDGAIVRYVQRVDGFVSADTGNLPGVLRTVPVRVTGPTLRLNVDTGALGELQVAVVDAQGRTVPGFDFDQCVPLQHNATGAAVAWRQADLAILVGREVALEFRSTRTKLYSFRFE